MSIPAIETGDAARIALDCRATPGHFDELRAQARSTEAPPSALWQAFFDHSNAPTPADLDQRFASLQRQIRDNGVTYNVYADQEGPQRPWSLDLFPLLVDAPDWQRIETGVNQRMRLLEALMADVYGSQTFLKSNLIPPALVYGHPGYMRPMFGNAPVGGPHLHVAAFDLARGPDGLWWLVGQRCQAPSGLGYLLENRLAVSRQFPQAFEALEVQRLAGTYRAMMDSLKALSPAGDDAHIALLTPGPYNETYFEHAYLARYLGLTLVEGSDLVVRDEHLYLKTLRGLVPVHGLLKRVDDEYLDPLELRADSTLGVPGLLQAVRAGNVLMANTPGSAFLESPALLGFMPALARAALGEELLLPALPTWWCGERAALQHVAPQLGRHTIKPSYPGSSLHPSFDTVLGNALSADELQAWTQRMGRHGDPYSVQAYIPLSQMPTWQSSGEATSVAKAAGTVAPRSSGQVVAKSVLLRVFAVSDGRNPDASPRWRVLPGGLARVAGASVDIASMQRGGSSADVWISMSPSGSAKAAQDPANRSAVAAPTSGTNPATTQEKGTPAPAHPGNPPPAMRRSPRVSPATPVKAQRTVTSRAAENLYWLGRYTERADNGVRMARLILECLGGEYQSLQPLQEWLSQMAVANTLVLPGVPSAMQSPRVFERALVSDLGSSQGATSVAYALRAIKMAAASVRERLSQEHWSIIVQAEEELSQRCAANTRVGDFSAASALRVLKTTSDHLAAITGAQTDRMVRDDGWRLLSIGRHVERLGFLSNALGRGLDGPLLKTDGGFEAMLALFDSTITFRASYQQSRDLAALTDLLVLDRDNPRALAWVAHTLRGRLAKLAGSAPDQLSALSYQVPDPGEWAAGASDGNGETLLEPMSLSEFLFTLGQAAYRVSDLISATYFTHTGALKHSVGT